MLKRHVARPAPPASGVRSTHCRRDVSDGSGPGTLGNGGSFPTRAL